MENHVKYNSNVDVVVASLQPEIRKWLTSVKSHDFISIKGV